ncbi:prevent-host-death protein [Lacticaseibacillus chiayiensis]|uniref:Prevent-host-death protein n=1 Tax=Lacticaseibacillus chiayiensis TaxID=2100821 RepID=A0A4Q1UI97_9LACO|nr:prevent-host-death protein [Lacticaseibacillus chiayiensis]RXT30728.1 prevent-host-death protein [Lacticaseibacillus chiayiensis]UYN56314.1 prevent-host-death protein [Lacticaseibacillus chiayiensis]
MKTYTPAALHKNLSDVLNKVAVGNEAIGVTLDQLTGSNKSVVLLNKSRYRELEELAFLHRTGTLDVVTHRMDNEKLGDFDKENVY